MTGVFMDHACQGRQNWWRYCYLALYFFVLLSTAITNSFDVFFQFQSPRNSNPL